MEKDLEKFNRSGCVKMSMNSLTTVDGDPTILRAKMIVHDFEVSGNGQVITEDVAVENIQTLVGKRICCKYISREENNGEDALGSHEEYESKNRDGEEVVVTDTIAIGFIESVYIDDFTDNNGVTKRAVFADAVIWNDDKYKDIVGLLKEWLDRGIKINMSVEYLYFNFNTINGIEYIQSPILYVAHTLLNSEDRGDRIEVLPSYDSAKLLSFNELQTWNKAVASLNLNNKQDIKEEKIKMENKFLKALNELSLGDIRSQIFSKLGEVMTANEYENMWISNYGIFPESKYFIYETYETDKWVNYKVSYSVDENDVMTIDLANKEEVVGQYTYVSVNELETSKNELIKANEKVAELEKSLNEIKVEKSSNQKIVDDYNELSEKVVSLNALVEKMKPIVDEHNKAVYEKALNSAISKYKEKFEGVNAIDVFEEEETQNLIKESLNSDKEVSKNAIFSLNKLIVDNVKSINEVEDKDDFLGEGVHISINSINKSEDNEDLIPIDEENIYKEKYGINY